tara:strand:- start:43 stop:678 length:636 start_codon:yes stop_codon:yes gene_type:complete
MTDFEDLPEGLNVGEEVNKVAGIPQVGDIYISYDDGTARMIVPSRAGSKISPFVGKKLDFGEDMVEQIMKETLTGVTDSLGFRVSTHNVGNIWYLEVPMDSAGIEGGGPDDAFIDKKRSGTWTEVGIHRDLGTWVRIKEAAYLEKSYGQSSEYSSGHRSIYEELVGANEVLSYKSRPFQPFVDFTENTEKKPVSKEKSIAIAPKSTGIKMF